MININKAGSESDGLLFSKPFALSTGILGFIQGISWTIFSVMCICCYTDVVTLDPDQNETEYYQRIYSLFLDADTNSTTFEYDILVKPKEFFIFMWFYVAFSIIWTCISGAVIWASLHTQWQIMKSLFGSWATITILISIVDIILTSLIAFDYSTLDGADDIDTVIIVCYGIVMSLAARGYILWLINIIFAAIAIKLVVSSVLKNKEPALPIIHGFEASEANPPWFDNSTRDLWSNPASPKTYEDYDNHGFTRSRSFVPSSMSEYDAEVPYYDSGNLSNRGQNFVLDPAPNRTAMIGRRKGTSPVHNVSPPIPPPDYTPPTTPTTLKSVLRSKSNYE
jgi:hypothetical protein